jgi:DNA polymerase III gamma/tau subunit
MSEENTLHRKYRPKSLDRMIGQEGVVTRVRGMLKTGKIPSAIIFFGPPSAGKTTLARIIASETNGKPVEHQQDYRELNAATQKGIDDVRELDKLSRFRAQGKRRFIVIDEAQQILTNAQAAQALLKPLEEPKADTTWIICSMEPEKFSSTVGRAIVKRCTQFHLDPPTPADLLKQAIRIAKGEGMDYLLDEKRALLKRVVRASNQDMRELAGLMQGVGQYYDGLDEKPDLLDASVIAEALASTESSDDETAVAYLLAVYSLKFGDAQRALLDVKDAFGFIKKLGWMSQFVLYAKVLNGEKHPALKWWGKGPELLKKTKPLDLSLGTLAAVNSKLVKIQTQALSFQVPAQDLLSAETYYLIRELKGPAS